QVWIFCSVLVAHLRECSLRRRLNVSAVKFKESSSRQMTRSANGACKWVSTWIKCSACRIFAVGTMPFSPQQVPRMADCEKASVSKDQGHRHKLSFSVPEAERLALSMVSIASGKSQILS